MTTISELKFACPVCHQHIVCDLSAAGAEIECPTCFRPVIVPKSGSTAGGGMILHARQAKSRPAQSVSRMGAVSRPVIKKQAWWVAVGAFGRLLADYCWVVGLALINR